MRTALDLPDPLLRKAKARAALEGTTSKVIFRAGVERQLEEPAPTPAKLVEFPVLRSKQPGALKLTNAQIDELLA